MKYNRFSLAVIAALVLIGSAAQAADIKIGLVTDVGRVNDRSFNQSAWQGVLEACEQLGGEEGKDCKYIETRDAKDYADNICLLYTSPSPRDLSTSRMPSSA